jgi:hypothetical protein
MSLLKPEDMLIYHLLALRLCHGGRVSRSDERSRCLCLCLKTLSLLLEVLLCLPLLPGGSDGRGEGLGCSLWFVRQNKRLHSFVDK